MAGSLKQTVVDDSDYPQKNTPIYDSTRLIPVSQWPSLHNYPTVRAFRHLIFNSKSNGFESVIRRIGRRVLIHEGEFFRWLDGQ